MRTLARARASSGQQRSAAAQQEQESVSRGGAAGITATEDLDIARVYTARAEDPVPGHAAITRGNYLAVRAPRLTGVKCRHSTGAYADAVD
jgi:hypothetical protein